MAISPKHADQFIDYLSNDSLQAEGCLNPDEIMMLTPDLYKQEAKQCASILKKAGQYWTKHGISGVTEKVLLDKNVFNKIIESREYYLFNYPS